MLHLLRASYLLGLLLFAQVAWADKLRLVADAWPPFTDATMVNGGLATELVTTALARAGYASQFEQVPWARALLGIEEGHYDVLVNAWYNEERTHIGEFSGSYLQNRILFLKRKGSPITFSGDLDALHPYPVAVVRGYAYSGAFDNDDLLQKVQVHNFSMGVRMLAAQRVELTLEDEYVARYYLSHEVARVRDQVEFLPQPLSLNHLHILVSLKNPDHDKIVAAFDKAIGQMQADGSYARLLKQYGM
ncbi:transporter substrate-binding domain-containing protein [Pseudomonas sp. App30]|uniref:substrate-binding periplasmic protein n=1 Tax=Pseudomonas sp. App30 TaxID=3068990 RepID=UPI003A8041CC